VGCVMRLDLRDAALADAPDRLAELALDRSARTGQQGRQPGRSMSTARGVRHPDLDPPQGARQYSFTVCVSTRASSPYPSATVDSTLQSSAPHEPAAAQPRHPGRSATLVPTFSSTSS
jgi:hypothetical protein